MAAPDPLEMAENCVVAVRRIAELQDSDPLRAYINRAGDQGFTSAQLAGNLALVSIARDLRTVVERLTADDVDERDH